MHLRLADIFETIKTHLIVVSSVFDVFLLLTFISKTLEMFKRTSLMVIKSLNLSNWLNMNTQKEIANFRIT